jgi:glutamate--cysteine ligase
VIRSKRRLGLKDFDPCTILLNNDLSAGAPGILEDMHEQYLLPPLHAGWSVRRKSTHFKSYEEVSKRFGKLLGIDPWLINPMFGKCGDVDFAEGKGMDCLQSNVDALLTKIRRKYKEYGINEKPFVVVKADNGTYGMGIMTVRDVKELEALNRKTKQQDGRHQGRPGGQRRDHPGRRADERAHERRRGRAGGLHDGPLRGGRLLPHACRARRG